MNEELEPRLVASGIMDIKMGAAIPEGVVGVGVSVGTLARGNGHQKSYVNDVVGVLVVKVIGLCRRNRPPCWLLSLMNARSTSDDIVAADIATFV